MMDKRNASVSVEKLRDEINFSRRSLYPDIWAGILTEARASNPDNIWAGVKYKDKEIFSRYLCSASESED